MSHFGGRYSTDGLNLIPAVQGRIKGGARGAAAPGPAISRGPHFWEVQKNHFKKT